MKNATLLLKLTFIILLSHVMQPAHAQIKIGNNPSTINTNSILELESTNKGFLPPRVPLTNLNSPLPLVAPIPSGMMVFSSGGTVPDGYYYWTGTVWVKLTSSANGRDNFVLVKSLSDLPAPVGGVITLLSNTVYEINGTISLSSKIDLNEAWLRGIDAVNDKLIYTASSGELFTGDKGGNIRHLTLSAPNAGAKVFNLDAGNANKNLIVQFCYIIGSNNIGIVKGYGGTVYMETIAYFYNTNGITYQDNNNMIISNTLWDISNSNTYETFTGSFSIIQKIGGDMIVSSSNSAVGINVSGISSIQGGELKTVLFYGSGIYKTGNFSKQWEVESNGLRTEKDDVAAGNIYITTPVNTSFSAINTPTKVLGTTTNTGLFRVDMPVNNRIQYTGTKTRRFQVICSLSIASSGNNKYYSFYIYKNGVQLPESRQALKLGANADKGSVTLSCTVELDANDYIEVWVENNTDATPLIVETMNFALK